MADQIWVELVHPESNGTQLIPEPEPAVLEFWQGKGWELSGRQGTHEDFAFGTAEPKKEPEKATKKAATKEEGVTGG